MIIRINNGKTWSEYTSIVKPPRPNIALQNMIHLNFGGISLIICLFAFNTVNIESKKRKVVLTKHRSITLMPVLVAIFARVLYNI